MNTIVATLRVQVKIDFDDYSDYNDILERLLREPDIHIMGRGKNGLWEMKSVKDSAKIVTQSAP